MRDYEELVKRLRKLADEQFFDFEKSPYLQAADAITELVSSADKFKWISTAERQPEKTGLYLCYTKKRAYLVLNYSKRHNTWNAFDSEDEPKHALEVTHWMPISEPPEEVQE